MAARVHSIAVFSRTNSYSVTIIKNGMLPCSIVLQVPTRKGSEPLHSLLVTQSEASTTTWSAPVGVENVELCIVLSTLSVVSSVVLFPGTGGYSVDDAPLVRIFSILGREAITGY